MTDRERAIADLPEKVEQAEGPSRELDAEIARALDHWSKGEPAIAPRFTASLDAALSLVPEGWGWSVNHSENRKHSTALLGRSYPTNASVSSEHSAPALALCAAALRAQAKGKQP